VTSVHEHTKAAIAPLRTALRSGGASTIQAALKTCFDPDAVIRLGQPFNHVIGPAELFERVYAPLLRAIPDLGRLDFIVMSGPRWGAGASGDWVGIGGNFVGTLRSPWLGIPATGTPIFMRYHEYFRLKDDKIVEMRALWDIPQIMLQVGVWPMAPQMGVEWMCPGPADGQGVLTAPHDASQADASVKLILDMLHDLRQGDANTPERGLDGFWHPNALWHGPVGLGTARGHASIANLIFRQFRTGLSDNTRHLKEGVFFGDQNLVAFTGWPSGTATHSGDGFLGLAPTGRRITRTSLDFWRTEDGLIRECWVMVDMIDLYRQLGIDVFARMALMTHRDKVT